MKFVNITYLSTAASSDCIRVCIISNMPATRLLLIK